MSDKQMPLAERIVREAISRGKKVGLPTPEPTCCYICGLNFKDEDWSTFFFIKEELEESIAHDDCLDLLRHGMWKDKPLFETGHKIWWVANE